MGRFLFQQWGLCRFQSSLPFPRPPPGFDFFICNGKRRTSAESPGMSSPGMCYREASAVLEIFIPCDRQAGSCLSPCGCSSSPSCCCQGNPCSKKKITPGVLCCSIAGLWTQSSQQVFPPVSLLVIRLDRGKVTKCRCVLFGVTTPNDRADADKTPSSISKFLFPKKLKHSHFSSGRRF